MKLLYAALFLLISTTILAQPANDDPCSATSLTVGSSCSLTSGTTVGSTNTSGYGTPSCSAYSNRDVWYSFVAPASGSVTIETATGTITDGAMSLYAGPDCSTLSEVTCDDDGGAGLMPLINASGLTAGATYYIRFWRYSSGTGTFGICVYDASSGGGGGPANDDPCSATVLTVDTVCTYTTGTNTDATNTSGVPAPGCASYSGGDVWYTFTVPSSGSFEINTVAGTLTDGGMAIYSGTCSSLSLVVCDDDSGPGLMPYIAASAAAGTTLWIRFWEFSNDTEGTFQICVTDPVASAENNDCVTATQICTTSSFDDNSAGDGSVTDITSANAGCLSVEHQSSWYYFQIETGGTLTFTIDPDVNSDDFDFGVWGPASSCPPSATPTRCSWSASTGNTGLNTTASDVSEGAGGDKWVQQMNVTAGEIYILCVDNFSATNNGFTFSFGGTATINCDPVILPVNLVSFTGEAVNATNVLEWITASEVHADYFSVEYSADGINFTEIGRQSAAGNSTETLHYEFIHTSPAFGNNYYRLVQYDLNGYNFPSVTINVSNTSGTAMFVYPNPASTGVVNVYVNNPGNAETIIEVVTAYGQPVYKISKKESGTFTQQIPLPAKGIYWISVQNGNVRSTEKVTY